MDFLLPADGGGGTVTACKVGGGGSIVVGTEGKFTVSAHADLKGNIAYRDVESDIDFRSVSIASVTCNDATHSARIRGVGANKNSTERKTYVIDVVDNGESGTTDVFGIQFGTYSKSGKLVRGNVQIH